MLSKTAPRRSHQVRRHAPDKGTQQNQLVNLLLIEPPPYSTLGFEVLGQHINTASSPSTIPDAIFNQVTLPATLQAVEEFHLRPQARGKTAVAGKTLLRYRAKGL